MDGKQFEDTAILEVTVYGVDDSRVVEPVVLCNGNGRRAMNLRLVNNVNPLAWHQILHYLPIVAFHEPMVSTFTIMNFFYMFVLANNQVSANLFRLARWSIVGKTIFGIYYNSI